DIQNRVTQTTAPGGIVTSTSYDFGGDVEFGTTMFLNTRIDPLGHARRSYLDIRGNLLAVSVDHDSASASVLATVEEPEEAVSDTTDPVAVDADGQQVFLPLVSDDTNEIVPERAVDP